MFVCFFSANVVMPKLFTVENSNCHMGMPCLMCATYLCVFIKVVDKTLKWSTETAQSVNHLCKPEGLRLIPKLMQTSSVTAQACNHNPGEAEVAGSLGLKDKQSSHISELEAMGRPCFRKQDGWLWGMTLETLEIDLWPSPVLTHPPTYTHIYTQKIIKMTGHKILHSTST